MITSCLVIAFIIQPHFHAHEIRFEGSQSMYLAGDSIKGFVFASTPTDEVSKSVDLIISGQQFSVTTYPGFDRRPLLSSQGSFLAVETDSITSKFLSVYSLADLAKPVSTGTNTRWEKAVLPFGRIITLRATPSEGARITDNDHFWTTPTSWEFESSRQLPEIGNFDSNPIANVESGYVAITYMDAAKGSEPLRAARWKNWKAEPESSPLISGYRNATAEAINKAGSVIGMIQKGKDTFAYLWKGSKISIMQRPAGSDPKAIPYPIHLTNDDIVVGRWLGKNGQVEGEAWISWGSNSKWLRSQTQNIGASSFTEVKLAANARDLLGLAQIGAEKRWFRLVGNR